MYAVIKAGGKQYKVAVGDEVLLDNMGLESKTELSISEVLMVGGATPKFGTPFVAGAVVKATVVNEGRGRKVITFKKRRRKDSKVKRGFRRDFTRVVITEIAA